ncbi:hypothetical protein ACFE04_008439 [Oxalis oulophora]
MRTDSVDNEPNYVREDGGGNYDQEGWQTKSLTVSSIKDLEGIDKDPSARSKNGNPPYGKWIKANFGAHVLGKGQSEGKNQGNGDDMEDSRTHATDFEEEAENQEESNSNLNFPPKVQLAMHASVDNLPHTRDSKQDKPLNFGPGPQQIILRPDSSKIEWITTMSSNQGK